MATSAITIFIDKGLVDFKECWDFQEELFSGIIEIKIQNRTVSSELSQTTPNFLIFCEHPHVFTLGKSGSEDNLLAGLAELNKIQASFHRINRGGDITYHGPGQIVGYPVIDLENFGLDIKTYIYKLEEAIILTLNDYGIVSERLHGATGVWIDTHLPLKARKICAIGVRASRHVSMHGFAFNINTDLKCFDMINPCGFTDKKVTSLANELNTPIGINDVKPLLKEKLRLVFGFDYI